MTGNGHRYDRDGKCVWCKVPRERVDDRRWPPWCVERPEDLRDDRRDEANSFTGY